MARSDRSPTGAGTRAPAHETVTASIFDDPDPTVTLAVDRDDTSTADVAEASARGSAAEVEDATVRVAAPLADVPEGVEASGSPGEASGLDAEPVVLPPSNARDARRRPGRRVVRVVRRVQLWSVFKIALLGSLILYVISMISVALLWSLATSTGQVHHIEKFMRDIGFDDWTFDGPVLFLACLNIGAVLMVVTSIMTTLAAAIMNLVSELTGGIRFTVIEELGAEDDGYADEHLAGPQEPLA